MRLGPWLANACHGCCSSFFWALAWRLGVSAGAVESWRCGAEAARRRWGFCRQLRQLPAAAPTSPGSAKPAGSQPASRPTEQPAHHILSIDAGPPSAKRPRDWRADMLRLINAERRKAGAPPLCFNKKLLKAATVHSADQARRQALSHTGSDGSDAGVRLDRVGYKWNTWAENVAQGYDGVAAVMAGWMASPGHRRNLLNPAFRHIGLGIAAGGRGPWWTQVFGAGTGERCS